MDDKISKKKFLSDHRNDIYICSFLILSVVTIYWQVINFDFIDLDDPAYVTGNIYVTSGFSVENLIRAFYFFQVGDHTYYHPLTWISHMLDCQIFGLSPGAHHLSNVFYHILNALLLFCTLYTMTGKRWQSAFVAALFALHPLSVESVAWISERKNLLSTFFWFLTILLYTLYARKKNYIRYLLILISMFLGLLAKPMLVTLPCVLLLLDLWPLNRIKFNNGKFANNGNVYSLQNAIEFIRHNIHLLVEKIPLFLLSIVWAHLTSLSNQKINAIVSTDLVPMDLRIVNALFSYIRYIGKMLWPTKLSIFYPYPEEMLPLLQIIGAGILLVSISLYIFNKRKNRPWLVVGWLWYLGTLVPVSGIVINGLWPAIADRWAYVPLVGIFIIITWESANLIESRLYQKKIVTILAASILVLLMITTWKHIKTWKNSYSVYQQALSATQDNSVAHNYFGALLLRKNDERCVFHFKEAIRLTPNWATAHKNIGDFFALQGKTLLAFTHYKKAIQLKPGSAFAHAGLGRLYMRQNKITEATYHYLQAIKFQPDYYRIHNELGDIYQKQGKLSKSIFHFQKSLQFNPEDEIMHYKLGMALVVQHKITEALTHYLEAVRIKPDFSEAHNNLGDIYQKQGKFTKSIYHFKKSLQFNPEDEIAHNNLGIALASQHKITEALTHYLEAVRINPDFSEAHNNLGFALLSEGKTSESIKHIKKSIALTPDFPRAYYNLGMALTVKGDIQNAENNYLEALRLNPSFFEAYNNLGMLYFREKKLKKAVKYFQAGLEKTPGNETLQHNFDIVISTQKKIDTAIEKLNNYLLSDSENPILYYQLGKMYQEKGEDELAMIHYNRSLVLNPVFKQALNALAEIKNQKNYNTQ